ncbi:MAG: hypothetical protein D6765_09135, partial [Bacteroidetes bacterium]
THPDALAFPESALAQWTLARDWQHLQAFAFVAFLCDRPLLGQRAWQLAREAYLARGGITAYAQDPHAFPWWVFWDALFLNRQLLPKEAWFFYRLGATWTPNLWDRTLRARVFAEWLRKEHAFSILRQLDKKEKQLANQFRAYRVDPLTWQTWRHLIYACEPWLVLAFLSWLALTLPFLRRRRPRPFLFGGIFAWLTLIFLAYTYPAWLETSFQVWLELKNNLLAAGFINAEVPQPWRALFEQQLHPEDLPLAQRQSFERWQKNVITALRRYQPASGTFGASLYRDLVEQLEQRSLTPISQNPVMVEKWWTLASSLPRSIPPAPWTLLHGLYPHARWHAVLLRAREIFTYQIRQWWTVWLVVPVLLLVPSVRRIVKPLVPGLSRLESGATAHGTLLFLVAIPTLFAFIAMHRLPLIRIWGALIDQAWLEFIDTIGRTRLILWGGLYLTTLGLTLMAWTLHFMAYFIDRHHQQP